MSDSAVHWARVSMGPRKPPSWVVVSLAVTAGCAALYPEVRTSLRDADEADVINGRPPRQMAYIEFKKARIPLRAPDGRPWDDSDDDPPDPVVRLTIDGERVLETPVEQDTFEPTWPEQRLANYLVKRGSVAVVELVDRDAMTDRPICVKTLGDLRSEGRFGSVEVMCDNGVRIWLTVKPPRPKMGLGLFYELHNGQVFVSRLAMYSPAGRAGLRVGDELIELDGQPVLKMDEAQIRSVFNAGVRTGIRLKVRSPGAEPREVLLKEGAVFVTLDDSDMWGSAAVVFEE